MYFTQIELSETRSQAPKNGVRPWAIGRTPFRLVKRHTVSFPSRRGDAHKTPRHDYGCAFVVHARLRSLSLGSSLQDSPPLTLRLVHRLLASVASPHRFRTRMEHARTKRSARFGLSRLTPTHLGKSRPSTIKGAIAYGLRLCVVIRCDICVVERTPAAPA
jgi:hypothetical protein